MNKRQARIEALSTAASALQGVRDSGHLYEKYENSEDAEKIDKAIRDIIYHLEDQWNHLRREREDTQPRKAAERQ